MERGLWHPLLPRRQLHLIHARNRTGLFALAIARGRNARRPGGHGCYGEDIREMRGRQILPPEDFGLCGVLSMAGVVDHEGMRKWPPVNGGRLEGDGKVGERPKTNVRTDVRRWVPAATPSSRNYQTRRNRYQ